jgi:hypothetical protein
MQTRALWTGIALTVVLVGCGGTFSTEGSTGGSPGSGGQSSAGGWTTGGFPSGGRSAFGGAIGLGGTYSQGGAISKGGSGGCSQISCAYPYCPDGVVTTPPGQCCPVCSCANTVCAQPICPPGVGLVTPPGACCPVCASNSTDSCSQVVCNLTPQPCPQGYMPGREPGACCAGCVPNGDPISINCSGVACPAIEQLCSLGYTPGHYMSECCDGCIPDPKYCQHDSDCLIADRPRSCCGCPEAISIRMYQEDACWFDVSAPRPIPQSCYPQAVCGAYCGVCAPPGTAMCVGNQCTEYRPVYL